jgi:glycosyltransferase involved in cell wall biosynthesis
MDINPTISVVMSVYNAEHYLKDAIESVLQQTYGNFEFIIINDGSSDGSLKIIQDYKLKDHRIVLINRENRGLIASLNEGLSIAKGKYIARMDADDICIPSRLEKQLIFLENNPEFGVVGSRAVSIDGDGKVIRKLNPPKMDFLIKSMLLFGNCIIHPSVMINRKNLSNELYYSSEFLHAEDYELWSRVSKKNRGKFYILGEPLIFYRIVKTSISRASADRQAQMTAIIRNKYFIKNGLTYCDVNFFEKVKSIVWRQKNKKFIVAQLAYVVRCGFREMCIKHFSWFE